MPIAVWSLWTIIKFPVAYFPQRISIRKILDPPARHYVKRGHRQGTHDALEATRATTEGYRQHFAGQYPSLTVDSLRSACTAFEASSAPRSVYSRIHSSKSFSRRFSGIERVVDWCYIFNYFLFRILRCISIEYSMFHLESITSTDSASKLRSSVLLSYVGPSNMDDYVLL